MPTRRRYRSGNLYYYDSANSPTLGSSLWETAPAIPHVCDPAIAHVFFDDFHQHTQATGGWILTQATSGTAVSGTLAGGVLSLDSGAITDGQGPQVQLTGIDFLPAAGKHIWYETRLKVSHITGDLFVGLAEIDTTLVATSAISTANHIGFTTFTGDGILKCDSEKATAGLATTTATTLVADTYIKLGFYVNGVTDITFYVNGVANATTNPTANVPIVGLTPSFTVHATGTDQAVLHVDYVKVAQLR